MPERTQDYEEMTVDELQQMAREQGMPGHSSMRKQELVEALQSGKKRDGDDSRSRDDADHSRRAS